MRRILLVAFCICLVPNSAFARSYKKPEPHHRYSTNGKFFLDFDPETNVHKMFSTNSQFSPLWQLTSDAFWPYKHDESDGCLYVADDGKSVAGPTWVHWEGKPEDYRVFDGLEFWNEAGILASYRISELPSWRLPGIDLPVLMFLTGIGGGQSRGSNVERHDEQLLVTTIGIRSPIFSLATGKITGWRLNYSYLLIFAFVYAIPTWGVTRWLVRRRITSAPQVRQQSGFQNFLLRHLGGSLVIINSIVFCVGVFFDSFGGTIDRIGGLLCRFAYSAAIVLIPVTFCIAAFGLRLHPRRIDWFGPWLAVMSAISILALLNAF